MERTRDTQSDNCVILNCCDSQCCLCALNGPQIRRDDNEDEELQHCRGIRLPWPVKCSGEEKLEFEVLSDRNNVLRIGDRCR